MPFSANSHLLGLFVSYDGRAASEPESSTRSRERCRVALVIREVTTHLDNKFDELAAKINIATAGLVTIANRELATFTTCGNQPDAEPSPNRISRQVCPVRDTDLQPRALRFDIFTRDDVVEIGVQTSAQWEPLDVGTQTTFVLAAEISTQTQPAAKHRRCRVNGRATQTDMPTDTNTSGVVWEQLPNSSGGINELDENVDDQQQTPAAEVKPCIINEAFLNVLMARMQTMVHEQLSSTPSAET